MSDDVKNIAEDGSASLGDLAPRGPDGGRPPPIRRGTSVEDTYEALRQMIMDGTYAPGQRLSQRALIEELKVGRTPLREALHMLEADGFLTSEANRGVTVAPATLDSAEELYAVRLLLEPPLIGSFTSELVDADFDRMEAALERMAATADRRSDFQKAHLDFHLVAIERYRQPLIGGLVLDLYHRIVRHQNVYMSRPRVPEDFVSLDRRLLEAMRARRADQVRRILEFHLIDAAVGLVLDVDPDHRFEPLPKAAEANGIRVDWADGGAIERPAAIRWPLDVAGVPALRTANLHYEPPNERGGRQS